MQIYPILISFLRQKWLSERAVVLHVHCLFYTIFLHDIYLSSAAQQICNHISL